MAEVLDNQEPVGRGHHYAWRLSLLGAWQLAGADRAVEVGANGRRLFALLALRGACDRPFCRAFCGPTAPTPRPWATCAPRCPGFTDATSATSSSRPTACSLRADVDVDVCHLQATASAILDGTLRALDRSTLRELAGDDLLVGWYEDWVLLERERLRQLRLHALEMLSGKLLAAGDASAAVEAGLATVAVEPLRESAHRAVIHAYLAEGNRAEALRQLARLRHLLRGELGVEPSTLVTDLFR
jgi:hypothetical protein